MDLYIEKKVFNKDVLTPGRYIGFKRKWGKSFTFGTIIDSTETELTLHVYNKCEGEIEVIKLQLEDDYVIILDEDVLIKSLEQKGYL